MSSTVYNPPPSLTGFLTSDAFVSLVTGPVGSGKSSAAMLKIAYHAKQMRPAPDGVRRSRAVVVRNTSQMLTDATVPTFTTWFPDGIAGVYMRTDKRFFLRFDDVECEVLFRGLDDANDVRRLLSLEVSFGVIDEFREINKDIYHALQGRVGRYPSVKDGGCVKDDGTNNYHIWGASNAPDADTFWEQYLSEPPNNADVFMQPSALAPEADWRDYLVDGYYENLVEGKSEDWVDVYVHNKFGRSLSGKPVFASFNQNFHVAKSELKPFRASDKPLIIGLDMGLNPSVTINQIDPRGRLLTYDAITSDNMGLLRFTQLKLKPLLASKYAGFPVIVVGDPAGVQRAQTDERSCFDILKEQGLRAIPARTNSIVARISAVDGFLTRQIDGGAAHLIDPGCAPLLKAMRGGYRYKIKKSGETEDKPEKNESSHVADAHQYACLHADSGLRGSFVTEKREVVRVSSRAWT